MKFPLIKQKLLKGNVKIFNYKKKKTVEFSRWIVNKLHDVYNRFEILFQKKKRRKRQRNIFPTINRKLWKEKQKLYENIENGFLSVNLVGFSIKHGR